MKLSESKESTKKSIARSFKMLALENPIEKITIKEITECAGVIRPTFYNHFKDKYDLLEWIIKTDLIVPIIPLMQGGFIREGVTLVFTLMEKEKDFYIKVAHLVGQNSFSEIAENLLKEILLDYIFSKVSPNMRFHNWMSPELVAEYYAQCIRFITVKWAINKMTIPPKELAFLCEAVLETNLDELIAQMR